MSNAPLHARLLAVFDEMPKQLQAAARWTLDHPQDVALLTVRQQSKRAGVVPATMTRLAQRLGFDGYDAVRSLYAESLRRVAPVFSGKVEALVARRELKGDAALAFDLVDALVQGMAGLAAPESLAQLTAAAKAIGKARRVYALGHRSSYPVAFHFAYVYGLAGGDVRLLDGPGATGSDGLRGAGKGDALVAVSVKPYTRAAVETTRYAARRGVDVVAITDSAVSPLARGARAAIVVATESPSFFHTMTPAFAAAEALAALLAAAAGDGALAAVRGMERQFGALATHLLPPRQPSASAARAGKG
ncbi:MAG: MurR/RpiR family transcriptional regulator [SAR324 cluster bacterium]